MTTNTTASPVRLHHQSSGQSGDDAVHVVILHGLFGDGENWRTQADRLSDRFCVHLMDLRNHGASPHTVTMDYHAMAADVAFTCQSIGVDSIHLIGHSMGGKTAMQIAMNTPQLLQSLTVVDIAPRQYPHHHQGILKGLHQLQADPITSRRTADERLAPFVENAGIRAFLLKNLRRDDNGHYRLRINLETISAHYNDIAAAVVSAEPFEKPTLFIKGENSDYLSASDQPLVQALFPAAKLKTIGGAGHWPHSEKPDVVHKILNDFLG